MKGGRQLLERFKNGIEVKHPKKATEEQRNDNRLQAIKEKFEQYTLDKERFKDYVKKENLHNERSDLLERLDNIDFSQANPRNNSFMNEISFLGESFAEGFVSVWGVERDNALGKYKDQLQVIEQRNDEKTKSRFFIGTFDNDKLNKISPFQQRKDKLERILDKQREEQQEQRKKRTPEQEQGLELKRERQQNNK